MPSVYSTSSTVLAVPAPPPPPAAEPPVADADSEAASAPLAVSHLASSTRAL